jgi:hypothetical protein
MTWTVILEEVFRVVLIPLLALLVKYICQFVNIKADEIKQKNDDATFQKYITMLNETIQSTVIATNQTYVESLKAQGKFDAEAQKVAFQMTYDAIIKTLGGEAQKYLSEAVGDLNTYIKNAIEANVNVNKVTQG